LITILFDIDGTLLRSGGAGLIAIKQVMSEMFGLESIDRVEVHGRTDNGILSDIFERQALSYEEHRDEFNSRYWERLVDTLASCPGSVLPGVNELLERLMEHDEIALGILTGNSQSAAKIKLEHFGLAHYFDFGGFGDFHSNRNDVASLALKSAESHLGERLNHQHLWVVGDTVNDVVCARAINARVIAVETGGGCQATLASSEPDCQLSSLSESETFFEAIGA